MRELTEKLKLSRSSRHLDRQSDANGSQVPHSGRLRLGLLAGLERNEFFE